MAKAMGTIPVERGAGSCTVGTRRIENNSRKQKAIADGLSVRNSPHFGRHRLRRSDIRRLARPYRRQEGIQPGILQHGHIYRFHPHRHGGRIDYGKKETIADRFSTDESIGPTGFRPTSTRMT